MKHYTELERDLNAAEFETVKNNKKVTYINTACGFDIETSSVILGDSKIAFSYIWMLGIGHDNGIYYGREWSDFLHICDMLQEKFDLSEDRRLVIYVHNLGYEFQFMRKYFDWVNVFSIDERKPLRALCSYGIEFRDSYLLSGYSLANTAKNLVKYTVRKLEGNLDYDLIRTPKTPLTEKEMQYCSNDIEIITAYITEQMELYGDIDKIPMTNTGRVRRHVKDECLYTSKNHKKSDKGKLIKYRKIMKDLTLSPDVYTQMSRAFMGGFTHGNAYFIGEVLEGVSSVDFTSSYPAVMVSEKFPMSRFTPLKVTTEKDLVKFCKLYAIVMDIQFTNIRTKIDQETYISESKCLSLVNPIINNGRVMSADTLSTTITEIDFSIMSTVYEWDSIEVRNVIHARKDYLPRSIIKSVLDLYQGKTELKDVEGSEVEYMLAKGMLNWIYGMSVTDVVMDKTTYEGEWGKIEANIADEVDLYNKKFSRVLYYPWGVWITAYARRNLWSGILAVGDDYVYSDTDALKIRNYPRHEAYIAAYNASVIEKMGAMCEHYKFDKKLLHPKTKEGVTKTLGIWDYEGEYTRFKTLGAKRYLVEQNGKLTITCAGLGKQSGIDYMIEKCNGDMSEVFEMFNDELFIPADRTGKMTHTYIDELSEFEIKDYLGEVAFISVPSGIHLEPCEFTLSMSRQLMSFIASLSKGYIYTGVKVA